MYDQPRVFRRTDPDFPTTLATQRSLIASGRVEGEGPLKPRPATNPTTVAQSSRNGMQAANGSSAEHGAFGYARTIGSETKKVTILPVPRPGAAFRPPAFTTADRSMITKVHSYMTHTRLLAVLNDRLHADRGHTDDSYSMNQLQAEIATLPKPKSGADNSWATIRKALGAATRNGTLARVDARIIADFAIIFSLTPKHLMTLHDVLLQTEED